MNKISIKTNTLLLFLLFSGLLFSQELNLMSFNLRYDNPNDNEDNWHHRKEKVIELIKNYEPAIFGIQEGLSHQVNYMDSCLSNYKYIGVGRDDAKEEGEYSAIFYDTTIINLEEENTFWLSESPDSISVGWDASMERICTYGLFKNKESGNRIWIFNTHFDHRGKEARKNSAYLILKKIENLNNLKFPIALMGDFNSRPTDLPIEIIKEKLMDGQLISENPFYGPTGTFNGFKNETVTNRIDYIFTDNLKVLRYIHIDDRLNNNRHISDHLPVFTTIRI